MRKREEWGNTLHSSTVESPVFEGAAAGLFLCGDDPDAKAVVARLGEELGFVPVVAGPLPVARFLEPLALLWMRLAFREDWGADFASKTLRR